MFEPERDRLEIQALLLPVAQREGHDIQFIAKECGYSAKNQHVLQVKLPLEVGTFMECEWKQGQYHRAKIIERRKRSDAPDYEYYVHYIGCEYRTLFLFCRYLLL